MSTTLPTPVAAMLGVVPTVLDSARRLPGKAVQLPVLAVANTLTLLESCRREYDELAGRGERLVARLRGSEGSQDFEEWLGGAVETLQHAVPEPKPGSPEALTDVVATVSDLLDRAAAPKPRAAVAKPFTGTPVPTDTAAAPAVVAVAEAVSEALSTGTLERAELPLPDYDHLTLGALRGQLHSLTAEQLVQVRDYEKAHADRLPVVTLLDNRLAKLTVAAAPTKAPARKAAAKKAPAKKAVGKPAVPALDL